MTTMPPWVTKGFEPRRASDGRFGSQAGQHGGQPIDRTNPDLDAAFADEPAKPAAPKPGADARPNAALDEFMAMGDAPPKPAAPQAKPAAGGKAPNRGKAAVRAMAAKATEHLKLAAAAEKAGDLKAAQTHRAAAYMYNGAAAHHEDGNPKAAAAVAKLAEEFASGKRQLNATPGAGPNTAAGTQAAPTRPSAPAAPTPAPRMAAPAGPGAMAFPQLQGKPAGNPTAQPSPAATAQPPALPHHRSEQSAQQAAKAVVQAAQGGGDVRQAHAAAMQALDEHLKAGIAELDRRGGDVQAKQRFAQKIAAARAKLNQLAGVDHPRTEPRQSVKRPAVKPAPKRRFGRKEAPPWIIKAAHDVSDEPRDEKGRWTEGGGSPDTTAATPDTAVAGSGSKAVEYTLPKKAAKEMMDKFSRDGWTQPDAKKWGSDAVRTPQLWLAGTGLFVRSAATWDSDAQGYRFSDGAFEVSEMTSASRGRTLKKFRTFAAAAKFAEGRYAMMVDQGQAPKPTGAPLAEIYRQAKERGLAGIPEGEREKPRLPNGKPIPEGHVACLKCAGHGTIGEYGHVADGVCFRCNGSGLNKIGKAAPPWLMKGFDLAVPDWPWVMKGWVTVGAKDGEGGTPVFMDGGKVTRGPKALVGERIGGKPKGKAKPKGKDRPAETKPTSVADRHKALAAAMPELTDDEMEAAGEYVSGAYKVINGALREGRELKAGERGAKYLKTLDAAIDRAPVLDEPVTVHRGMKFQGEAADKFLARARALAESGDTLTDPAYGSATIDPDIAHDWVKAGDGTKVVMQIEASKGLYLGESAGGSKEKEFLLPRGTQYRILGVEERDGVHYVRAEQVVTEKGLACPWVVKLIDASGHEHAADGRFGSGGGKVAAADEPASHPSRSSRSVVHAATASLPDHVKDSPAKLDKVLRAAANLHVKLYPKLMKLGLLVHEFAPEILDTAEDFESIAKAKTGTGRPMGAATGNDPIYDATGMPGYWVLGSLVPKIAGAVAGYMARKKKAHDPWTAEKFAEVAKATRKLWAEAVRATGARFPLPSESEIIAHLERKHGATADDETGPDVDDPSDRAPRAAEKSALPGLAVSPPWVMKEAAFDESKHPRDHGQFSSKPGAKGGENKGPPTEDDE